MFGETFGMKQVDELVEAAKRGERCLIYFINKYPDDPEITAAKIDLKTIQKYLRGW